MHKEGLILVRLFVPPQICPSCMQILNSLHELWHWERVRGIVAQIKTLLTFLKKKFTRKQFVRGIKYVSIIFPSIRIIF
jgi:hypothetical protein